MTPQAPITGDEVADGWIAWSGGECPVDLDARVDVKFRDGEQHYGANIALAYHWAHFNQPVSHPDGFYRGADIIEYRLNPAATAARQQGVGK